MAEKTTNFGLNKPRPEDFYDITLQNENMDIIERELSNRANLENGKVPLDQLPDISSVRTEQVVLHSNSWVLGNDDRYYQTVNVTAMTTSYNLVMVDVDLSTDDADAKIAYLEGWSYPAANEVDEGYGTLTFYAWEKPTVNIPVNVGVM